MGCVGWRLGSPATNPLFEAGKGGVELTFLGRSGAMGDVFCGLEGKGRRLESI